MSQPPKDTRQKAAAARAAQVAKEKRRERTIRLVGALVVLVVVGGIIGGAIFFSGKDSPSAGPTADPNNALPTGVSSSDYGYQVTAKPAAGAPLVQIWEDFQCPACAQFEKTFMASLLAESAKGAINMQWRPTTFLDQNLAKSKDSTSARSTSAWGCAINAGKAVEYHSALFAAQPSESSPDGTTQAQLAELGKTVGITGKPLETFTTCVVNNTYLGWAANSTKDFTDGGVAGTPAMFVNGEELPLTGITTPAQLMEKIKAAAA